MSESSILAVRSKADALGIQFQKDVLIEELAQDAEARITQFLEPAILLKNKTHSQKLTCEHIQTIANTFLHCYLFGYGPDSEYQMKEETVGDSLIAFVQQEKVQLSQVVTSQTPAAKRELPFDFKWKKVKNI